MSTGVPSGMLVISRLYLSVFVLAVASADSVELAVLAEGEVRVNGESEADVFVNVVFF